MAQGINVSYGALNISTPAIVMPAASRQIGSMAQQVTQYMQNSEGSAIGTNTAPAYSAVSALMANNANFQAQQNVSNANFNNVATNAMMYQANAISHQGKKG